MTGNDEQDKGPDATLAGAAPTLRERAEARLLGNAELSVENVERLSPEAAQATLHELRVHQIELEMQNEELRESQAALDVIRTRYFDLYDLAPVGYCTIGETGLIKQANLTIAGLLGVQRGALIQKPLSRFISNADQDIYYLHRKRLIETSEPQSCELRMTRQDGTPFWGHLSATLAQDGDGVSEMRAILTDITSRKQAEAARQTSEGRLSGLIHSVPDAIIVIDIDHRIVLFNPAAELLFGIAARDIIGASLDRLIPERFRGAHGTRIREFALTNISARTMGESGRIFGVHADGTEFPVDATIAQLEVNGEKLFTVVLRDVSEREHLYQMLQERSAAIESEKLVAEKANRAKSEFLSSMSHELRTPLNAILGFAQLLDSGTPALTPLQKGRIDQILRSGWYLLALVNEILDLALIDSGKLLLSVETVSLTDVIRECQAMMEPQAHSGGINLAFPDIKAPIFVKGDPTRLKQVLVNLLSNAIKYNHVGGSVVVECEERLPGQVRICVTDTGPGLPPDKVTQLFQPFNRLGQEGTAVEGTGIGLVVSKRLVELMGGTIGVESTVGVGSVFWVEMCLALPPELGTVAVQPSDALPGQMAADGPSYTVLYVEDNPANMMLVEELVARRVDIRLLKAADALNGIMLARAEKPDVILMDINLPGMSGLQALHILAGDPATAHIPLVAVSANAMPHDIEKALAAGFFRYVTKPIKIHEFMETLDAALRFSTMQARIAAQQDPWN